MSRVANLVSVEEGYQRWAPTYDRVPNPLLAREERHLIPLLAGLGGKRVLDLACGTGRWLGHLSAIGANGVGIDRSAAMLTMARGKPEADRSIAQGTCELLPLRDAMFDFAICSFALGHILDLRSTAAELRRVLRPGSELFITDLHPEAIARGWRVGFRDAGEAVEIEASEHAADGVIDLFTHEGFECLLEESLWLGEPEKSIFERSGKVAHFREACAMPAVIVFHFGRIDLSTNSCLG